MDFIFKRLNRVPPHGTEVSAYDFSPELDRAQQLLNGQPGLFGRSFADGNLATRP
jgi:hypothetical protein